MIFPSRLRFISALLLCLLTAVSAQESTGPAPTASTMGGPPPGLFTRLGGLFNIDLPQLDPPGTYKLIFHPHFGDFFNRGYIRTDIGLRWALNENFGVNAEADTFLTHGLRSSNYGYGIGQVRGGFKYVFKAWPRPQFQTSLGFDTAIAVNHPPIDMTDGLRHYTPNVAIQYRPPAHPRWTTFGGINVDFVSPTDILSVPGINTPRDDSLTFTTGAIYDMGQLKWTLQGTWTTTALIGERTQNFYSIRPSVLWYMPKRFDFISKTQWIVGLGINSSWGPDGYHLSTGTRLRAEITFKQAMQKIHDATTSKRK